jgi:hypothetical protein
VKLAVLGRGKSKTQVIQAIAQLCQHLRLLGAMLLAVLLLSGCVKYDVGVNFQNLHNGQIVQDIKLGEQLTSLDNAEARAWLNSIERRTRQLEGKTKRLSKDELRVTIPFHTGKELEAKLNQFFSPNPKKGAKVATTAGEKIPEFNAKVKLIQSNFLLFVRNKLSYDVDLRDIGTISADGNKVVSPDSLFDFKFSLQTPKGAKNLKRANAIAPEVAEGGKRLVWTLKPGEFNHLEAVFWFPSPLGIGTVFIVLLVLAGYYLKYKELPAIGELLPQLPKSKV